MLEFFIQPGKNLPSMEHYASWSIMEHQYALVILISEENAPFFSMFIQYVRTLS